MRFTIVEAVLAASYVTSALAAAVGPQLNERSNAISCSTEPPPTELVQQHATFASNGSNPEGHVPIVVSTYFHVVTTASKQNRFTRSMLNEQVSLSFEIRSPIQKTNNAVKLSVMNNIYGDFGITFELAGSDFTVNDEWAQAEGNYVRGMKPALRKGDYRDLNVYFLSDFGQGTPNIGVCNYPTGPAPPGSNVFQMDGCQVHAETIPGVANPRFSGDTEGKNAVHEVGHWFGLLHVFEGNTCSADGDHVADTPYQSTSSGGAGCNPRKDSCPDRSGLDSIHNYMDYGSDECKSEFTPGQEARMFQMWDEYRAGK